MQPKIPRLKRKREENIFKHQVMVRQQQVTWLTKVTRRKLTLSDVQLQQTDQVHTHHQINIYQENALELIPTLDTSSGIKIDDCFTVYYNGAESLLKAFKNSLTSLGMDQMMANQHQNHVELIWPVVSKEMRIFPIHPISNLHLFWDYYHYPIFKMIG